MSALYVPVDEISVAARQKVEILKLLYRNVDALIHEPTAVLIRPKKYLNSSPNCAACANNGHTILFISHHLDEVLALSDRITVLRKGQSVATVAAAETSEREPAALMVGREVLFQPLRAEHQMGTAVVSIRDSGYVDPNGG